MMMMKLFWLAFGLSMLLSLSAGDLRAQQEFSVDTLKSLVGQWKGELEYLDYRDNRTRVVLRTAMDARLSMLENQLILNFVHRDPAYEVESLQILSFDAETKTILSTGFDNGRARTEEWRIAGFVSDSSGMHLVLLTSGYDDSKPATIRRQLRLNENRLTVRKEVQYEGEEYFFRNEVRLERWGQ
jgi:hypothetical protein